MSLARPGRLAIGVAVAWTCAVGAAFWYLFGRDDTDDYAGWLFVVYALQVPAYLAAVTAPRDHRFGTGRALAVALPVGLVTSDAIMWAAGAMAVMAWPDRDFDQRPLGVALAAGMVTLVAAAAWSARTLGRRPHPRGYTTVLKVVTGAGVAALLLVLVVPGRVDEEPGFWILLSSPLAFVAPLWIVVRWHPAAPPPVPVARARRS